MYSSSSPAFNSSNQSYSSSVGDGVYHHSASGSYSKFATSQSFDQTKKSLDDELKELDSQLDSQLDSKMLSKVCTLSFCLFLLNCCSEFFLLDSKAYESLDIKKKTITPVECF